MQDAQQLRKVSILLNIKNKYEAKIFNRFSQVNFLGLDKKLSNSTVELDENLVRVLYVHSTNISSDKRGDNIKNVLVIIKF